MRLPLPSLLLGAAFGLTLAMRPRRPRDSFAGRVVLITGGSRGLGLVLARELVRQGARVTLMARDGDELARAASSIAPADHVATVQGDVRRPEDGIRAVAVTVARFHRLDVLINNAGVIVSSPVAHTAAEDFRSLMDVHFWGTMHMTSAALPHLLKRRGTRVVNICSIGAKMPVPHLAAYCASKCAQAGLSSVLAQELAGHGVKVSTVYPGLMRTGSHLNARFRGDTAKEFAAFALASGLPGVSMGADRAARLILSAVSRGQAEIVVPFSVRQLLRLSACAPNLTAAFWAAVARALPDGAHVDARHEPIEPPRGADVGLHPVVRAAVVLSERAAERNNERSA